jgi:Rod binding domain-containing protein
MNAISTAPTTYAPDPRQLAQQRAAMAKQQNEAAIGKVAEDFEAFFAGAYFEQMFSGIEPDPITGGGEGEAMFRSLMVQEYGKSVAKQHVLGIADVVKRQLLQLQEQQ